MGISYNTMNNNWMNLFQQSLGMLGMNNTLGSFGSMSMNGSLFNYNVNYDAMAGMAVANAVLGVSSQAISSSKAEKQADKQEYAKNQKNLENMQNEIDDLKDIASDNNKVEKEIDSKYDKNIVAAITSRDNAKTALDTAKESKKQLEAKKTGKTPEEIAKIDEQIKKLNLDEKENTYNKLNGDAKTEGSVKYYEAQKAQAIKDKKAEINDKIKNLEKNVEKLQKEVDSYDLDAANGNSLSRTSDKKYNALLNENGVAPKGSYTKANVKTAVDKFMQALDGTPEKLQTAKNLVTMFEGCSNWNETLQKAAKVAQRYVDEHKVEK